MARLLRFGPPVALMVVIFLLSAQAHLSSGLGVYDLIARKLAHMSEYGVLWWLWLRALRFRRPWIAAAIAIAYAATDEFHQTFVAGRHGTPVDVAIDAVGVALAWLAMRAILRRRYRQQSARERQRLPATL